MKAFPPAIFLMGPTASGKTGVAVELVQNLPLEIISVDSALVFRDMDIGTAKPDAATLAQAPHHLINILSPTEAYSAAAFRKDALRLMGDITARGKVPLLVGGTILYFKALREGLSDLPQSDATLRAQLDAEITEHGIAALHKKLAAVDPLTAARLHRNDTQRIQRAMEIYLAAGKPMSELIKDCPSPQPRSQRASGLSASRPVPEGKGWGGGDFPYRLLSLALIPSDRALLHHRIALRFDQMLKDGLVDELNMLRKKYALLRDLTAMRCVGYRQAWEFLEGEIDEAGLKEKGIAATRQLAKRQLTWLRGMETVQLDCLANNLPDEISGRISAFLHP